VRDHRGGRALALRTGDPDDPPPLALGEPQPGRRDDPHAVLGEDMDLRAVDRHAGRAHDDVASAQRGQRVALGHDTYALQIAGLVGDDDLDAGAGQARAGVLGQAAGLAPEAPQAYRPAVKLREPHGRRR
jgi:hypothetical protein